MARNFGIRQTIRIIDSAGRDVGGTVSFIAVGYGGDAFPPEPDLTWPRVLAWSLALALIALPAAWAIS